MQLKMEERQPKTNQEVQRETAAICGMQLEMEERKPETNQEVQRETRYRQYIAAICATLGAMCAGAVMGWTSPALPYLQLNTTANVTDDEAAWIGSLAPLGALAGAVPGGLLADAVGRRTLLLLLSLPFLAGYLLILFSNMMVPYIYAGRFVLGFAIGAVTCVTPLYCEEIAEEGLRGALGVYLDLMVTIGILWSYAVGALDQYWWLTLCSCALPLCFALAFFWMPETPVHLLSRGRVEEAREALRWLRGRDDDALQEELTCLQHLVEESSNRNSCKDVSSNSPVVRSFRIVLGLMFFQQMSGINAIVFYTVDIFQDVGGSISPKVATIIVGIVQVLATFLPLLVVEKVGRCILLLISSTFMAVCLGGLSLYFLLKETQPETVEGLTWVSVVLVAGYIILFSMGFGPLPWFMMAELVPAESKGWISATAVCLHWSLVFFVTNVFPTAMRDFGPVATYGVLGLICAAGSVFVSYVVPETRGKTREEIQRYLRGEIN